MVNVLTMHVSFVFSELTEVKEHDKVVTEQAKRAQEDVSIKPFTVCCCEDVVVIVYKI